MKKTPINPKESSVAATFYEPVYQRLRQWHKGRELNLLCFVNATTGPVQNLLYECSAAKSAHFRADCFAEVWELADGNSEGTGGRDPCELDKRISAALGCLGGRYSATTGQLLWGDVKEEGPRRHFASKLLQESLRIAGRAR